MNKVTRKFSCLICEDKSNGYHFGVLSCRACAAFFRRCVAGKLRYVCRFDDACEINKDKRVMCRSCRLKKCYKVGMNPNEVQTNQSEASGSQQKAQISNKGGPNLPEVNRVSTNDISSTSVATSNMSNRNMLMLSSNNSSPSIRNRLHEIIEQNKVDYIFDQNSLPLHYSSLMQMYMGYDRLLARRDHIFARFNSLTHGQTRKRSFIDQKTLNIQDLANMSRLDLDGIAEMLEAFPGYKQLVIDEKVTLFKHFYTHFLILERIYESYKITGTNLQENKLVMVNGDIFDVSVPQKTINVDIHNITDWTAEQVSAYINPWFLAAPKRMLEPMKRLLPNEIELMFALGYILWKVCEIEQKLSPQTILYAKNIRGLLMDELSSYYSCEMPGSNGVRRICEIMELINMTEKFVTHRNEYILLNKIFKYFNKTDAFNSEIFDNE